MSKIKNLEDFERASTEVEVKAMTIADLRESTAFEEKTPSHATTSIHPAVSPFKQIEEETGELVRNQLRPRRREEVTIVEQQAYSIIFRDQNIEMIEDQLRCSLPDYINRRAKGTLSPAQKRDILAITVKEVERFLHENEYERYLTAESLVNGVIDPLVMSAQEFTKVPAIIDREEVDGYLKAAFKIPPAEFVFVSEYFYERFNLYLLVRPDHPLSHPMAKQWVEKIRTALRNEFPINDFGVNRKTRETQISTNKAPQDLYLLYEQLVTEYGVPRDNENAKRHIFEYEQKERMEYELQQEEKRVQMRKILKAEVKNKLVGKRKEGEMLTQDEVQEIIQHGVTQHNKQIETFNLLEATQHYTDYVYAEMQRLGLAIDPKEIFEVRGINKFVEEKVREAGTKDVFLSKKQKKGIEGEALRYFHLFENQIYLKMLAPKQEQVIDKELRKLIEKESAKNGIFDAEAIETECEAELLTQEIRHQGFISAATIQRFSLEQIKKVSRQCESFDYSKEELQKLLYQIEGRLHATLDQSGIRYVNRQQVIATLKDELSRQEKKGVLTFTQTERIAGLLEKEGDVSHISVHRKNEDTVFVIQHALETSRSEIALVGSWNEFQTLFPETAQETISQITRLAGAPALKQEDYVAIRDRAYYSAVDQILQRIPVQLQDLFVSEKAQHSFAEDLTAWTGEIFVARRREIEQRRKAQREQQQREADALQRRAAEAEKERQQREQEQAEREKAAMQPVSRKDTEEVETVVHTLEHECKQVLPHVMKQLGGFSMFLGAKEEVVIQMMCNTASSFNRSQSTETRFYIIPPYGHIPRRTRQRMQKAIIEYRHELQRSHPEIEMKAMTLDDLSEPTATNASEATAYHHTYRRAGVRSHGATLEHHPSTQKRPKRLDPIAPQSTYEIKLNVVDGYEREGIIEGLKRRAEETHADIQSDGGLFKYIAQKITAPFKSPYISTFREVKEEVIEEVIEEAPKEKKAKKKHKVENTNYVTYGSGHTQMADFMAVVPEEKKKWWQIWK